MTRWQWFGATMAFAGAILLTSWMSSSLRAQQPRLEYPLPGPCSCVPNVMTWGHYEPQWRRWPGEVRLEQINPHAPGSGVLPTPEGREIVPPPKSTVQMQPQPGQQQPQPSNKEEKESILPPGANLAWDGRDADPLDPGGCENKPGTGKPTIEGELPAWAPNRNRTSLCRRRPNSRPRRRPLHRPKLPPSLPRTSRRRVRVGKTCRKRKPHPILRWFGRLKRQASNPPDQRLGSRTINLPPAARGTKGEGVMALTGGMEPERNATLPGAAGPTLSA